MDETYRLQVCYNYQAFPHDKAWWRWEHGTSHPTLEAARGAFRSYRDAHWDNASGAYVGFHGLWRIVGPDGRDCGVGT